MATAIPIDVDEIARKVNPRVISEASGMFWAIFGYLVDRQWTDPHFLELNVDSNGNVWGARSTDAQSVFLAQRSEVERNVRGVCGVTRTRDNPMDRVTEEEEEYLVSRIPPLMRVF